MNEQIKNIKGFEGLYQILASGHVYSIISDKILKLSLQSKGYVQAGLYKNKKCYKFLIHRLVAEAFLGECPYGLQVNHKDGYKLNNNVNNLEYTSCYENMNHAGMIKLSAFKIICIKNYKKSFDFSQSYLARLFNVSQPLISLVLNNKLTHIVAT